ncbi:hypothetical protein [Bacillus sp. NPDC094106]|uniref:hypothetical protein n=1 Tax=Bacillus sp. NPDC094106 TaxID=3363949 RepID=UPI00381607C0
MDGPELATRYDEKIIEYYLTMLEKGEGTKKLFYSSMFDYELGLDMERIHMILF